LPADESTLDAGSASTIQRKEHCDIRKYWLSEEEAIKQWKRKARKWGIDIFCKIEGSDSLNARHLL
jgi:hypothetical protein